MKEERTGHIYLITHNGKPVYVGQTVKTAAERWRCHLKDFLKPESDTIILYKAFRKYGPASFRMEPLVSVPESMLNDFERGSIRYYGTHKSLGGYNMTWGGDGFGSAEEHPMFGKHHTEEAKLNLRLKQLGKVVPPEVRQKMSDGKKGQPKTAEHRAKLAAANIGKTLSQETRQKMSVSLRGIKKRPEEIARRITTAAVNRALRKAQMTPEQLEAEQQRYSERGKETYRRKLAAMTPEDRAAYLEARKEVLRAKDRRRYPKRHAKIVAARLAKAGLLSPATPPEIPGPETVCVSSVNIPGQSRRGHPASYQSSV